jgi:hypothetical protein
MKTKLIEQSLLLFEKQGFAKRPFKRLLKLVRSPKGRFIIISSPKPNSYLTFS